MTEDQISTLSVCSPNWQLHQRKNDFPEVKTNPSSDFSLLLLFVAAYKQGIPILLDLSELQSLRNKLNDFYTTVRTYNFQRKDLCVIHRECYENIDLSEKFWDLYYLWNLALRCSTIETRSKLEDKTIQQFYRVKSYAAGKRLEMILSERRSQFDTLGVPDFDTNYLSLEIELFKCWFEGKNVVPLIFKLGLPITEGDRLNLLKTYHTYHYVPEPIEIIALWDSNPQTITVLGEEVLSNVCDWIEEQLRLAEDCNISSYYFYASIMDLKRFSFENTSLGELRNKANKYLAELEKENLLLTEHKWLMEQFLEVLARRYENEKRNSHRRGSGSNQNRFGAAFSDLEYK